MLPFDSSKKTLTMYVTSKEIHAEFSVLTTPSFGTIKPALTRLEKAGFLKIGVKKEKGWCAEIFKKPEIL